MTNQPNTAPSAPGAAPFVTDPPVATTPETTTPAVPEAPVEPEKT